MATLESIKLEMQPYINTLVITASDIVMRLVDVIEDEDDYYYEYDYSEGTVLESCLCLIIPLKGFIQDKHYKELVRCWNLNNIIKAV